MAVADERVSPNVNGGAGLICTALFRVSAISEAHKYPGGVNAAGRGGQRPPPCHRHDPNYFAIFAMIRAQDRMPL